MKALLASSFLGAVLAITSPTAAAGSPPPSERASQVKALVIKAAALFPKPGQTEPSQKWAYVKKVSIDGVPGLVASGFYP